MLSAVDDSFEKPLPRFADASYRTSYLGSVYFSVSNPRPPTIALALTVPEYLPPEGPLLVSVTVSSFLGTSAEGVEVTITWDRELNRQNRGKLRQASLPRRTATIVTAGDGSGTAKLDLGPFEAELEPFADIIRVEAVLVGPTRERVVAEASLPVAVAPVRLSLSWLYAT